MFSKKIGHSGALLASSINLDFFACVVEDPIIVGGRTKIMLFRQSDKKIFEFASLPHKIVSISFSNDGGELVVGSPQGVKVFGVWEFYKK